MSDSRSKRCTLPPVSRRTCGCMNCEMNSTEALAITIPSNQSAKKVCRCKKTQMNCFFLMLLLIVFMSTELFIFERWMKNYLECPLCPPNDVESEAMDIDEHGFRRSLQCGDWIMYRCPVSISFKHCRYADFCMLCRLSKIPFCC